MNTQSDWIQPGDPEQLARVIEGAEYQYERSRIAIVVYWDDLMKSYRLCYQGVYKPENNIEVVSIPWKV